MATWRVFKQMDTVLSEGVIAAWDEYPPLETEYSSWATADEVGAVAGAGQYLLIAEDIYPRVLTIEVTAITRYEEVEPPTEEPPNRADLAEAQADGFSVGVAGEQAEPVQP